MKRTISIILTIMLLCTGLYSVNGLSTSTIDKNETGTIHITKYQKVSETIGNYKENHNIEGKVIPNVEFRLIPVMNSKDVMDYYMNSDEITIDDYLIDGKVDESKIINDYSIQTKKTDENGCIDFTNVKVGLYILEELAGNDVVNDSKLAPPQLIAMPTTLTENNKDYWSYELYVYPKNELTSSQIELIKYGQAFGEEEGSVRLEGITFKLQKKVNDEWIDIYAKSSEKGDNTGELYPNCEEGKSQLITDEEGKIELDGLSNGHYRFREVDLGTHTGMILSDDDYIFDVKNGVVSFENFNQSIDARASDGLMEIINYQPYVEKQIVDEEDSYRVGDIIDYQISSVIPGNIGKLASYEFYDTPKSLKITKINSVKVGDTEIDESMYDITMNDDGGFTIKLKNNGQRDLLDCWKEYANQELVIYYSAEVLPNSDTGQISNTVRLDYSSETGSVEVPPIGIEAAEEAAYFKLKIQKTFNTNVKNKKGVEFQLSQDGYKLKFSKTDEGIYYPDDNGSETLVTDSSGVVEITGLDNGVYTLKEIKTLSNFNILKESVKIKISYEYEDGQVVPLTDDATTLKDNEAYVEILNKKKSSSGLNLPKTSGYGLLFISLAGIACIYLGFKFIYLKKDDENEM